MTILYSFCSLSMVMALLCVIIIDSLLGSQQSYTVSLLSMLISILCKNLAVIRKMLPSPQSLLPIWSAISGRESKPLYSGKGMLQVRVHRIPASITLKMTENGLTLIGISLSPKILHPARNARKLLPVSSSLLQQILKTDYDSHDFPFTDKSMIKSSFCCIVEQG